ncbi:MAG: D-alanyl-D-alanine carboxypeptidase [Chitinophagaceae bacterium]|nr:D-alanyl-D-alanine carboxypeptidase [Chitinophagaceae bacterium]
MCRNKFFILLFLSCIFLCSCSISKRIAKSAKTFINDESLVNAHAGISIYDASSNKYLFNYQGNKYFVPASNTKIPTCYAAMKYLGDSLVGLQYNIINESTVDIAGTGDPTFLCSDFKRQPVYDFLKKFKTIVYKGEIYTDFLGSGWSWGDYKQYYMAQRSELPMYGNVVTISFKGKDELKISPFYFRNNIEVAGTIDSGFAVDKPWDNNRFFISNGGQKESKVPYNPNIGTIVDLLADTLKAATDIDFLGSFPSSPSIIYSQPTDSLLKPMMYNSDNFFAEQSLLMVSKKLLNEMTDSKIIDTLLKTDFKDLPQKPNWADGSGLSRYNLFTPQDFVFILNKMKDEFGMKRVQTIFPTGNTGTLEGRYKNESGYIFAKTGTLSGVVSLSGFLYTKKNKLLIFSVLVNNHNGSATEVRNAIERFISGLRKKY